MRRRRSVLAVLLAVVLALIVIAAAPGVGGKPVRVTYDRRAAAAYADHWALKVNSAYWSSPNNDCANFVSQCLAAGGLRPTADAGREWRADGAAFPTLAWVNCEAQKRALSQRSATHSRYIVAVSREVPSDWAAGDVVYLGNRVHGCVEWQHVIICVGRRGGEFVYDSHTNARKRRPLGHWYPAHFSEVRFCRIADVVSYEQR
ncbi:MAG: amidase domain-containing protein [Thermoleophilia bacterium]